jgi:hypothetical protein
MFNDLRKDRHRHAQLWRKWEAVRQVHKMLLGMIGLALVIIGNTAVAAGAGNNIAIRLVGSQESFSSSAVFPQYGITGPESFCWDFDMVDVKTGDVIGYATDCGAIIGVVGEGLQVLGTTIFHFPGGTIASRVYTTLQPVTHGSPQFTHLSGAVPPEGTNNVIYGDGKFQSAEGTVRFSGIGDFSQMDLMYGGVINIDCIFTLDIKTGQ